MKQSSMKQSDTCVLVIDVGGTTIGYALIKNNLEIIGGVKSRDSKDYLDQEQIIYNFDQIIEEMKAVAVQNNSKIIACSIGFPNPFNYSQGIPMLKHKFQAVYGLNLKKIFEKTHKLPFLFLNDADAFGYGVLNKYFTKPPSSLITITLGTGIGVSYFKFGELIDLEIWDMPYKHHILEDFLSARVITGNYKNVTGETESSEDIAKKAMLGDSKSIDIFKQFGQELGNGLAKAVGDLRPEKIISGGAISGSFSLFGKYAEDSYRLKTNQPTNIEAANNADLALYGAAAFAYSQLAKPKTGLSK